MDADEFQKEALVTLKDIGSPDNKTAKLVYFALAINGEAGELAEVIKKAWRNGKDIPANLVAEELGDILWYIAVMAHEMGFPLSEIMRANIEKLRVRYGGVGTNANP